jgi:hypothetical protein
MLEIGRECTIAHKSREYLRIKIQRIITSLIKTLISRLYCGQEQFKD